MDPSTSAEQLGWEPSHDVDLDTEVLRQCQGQVVRGLAKYEHVLKSAAIEDGWQLVSLRSQILIDALQDVLFHVVAKTPPSGDFAIDIRGGTGRRELCPGSDFDLGIVLENVEENGIFCRNLNKYVLALQPIFPGLKLPLYNSIQDLQNPNQFDLLSLLSMLDSELLVGEPTFYTRVKNICSQRSEDMKLNLVFHAMEYFERQGQKYPDTPGTVSQFNVKDGIGGLRHFLLTTLSYGFPIKMSSKGVYALTSKSLPGAPTQRVIDAVGVLLMARSWIEQTHASDPEHGSTVGSALSHTFGKRDFYDFEDRFGQAGLAALQNARREVLLHQKDFFAHMLNEGIEIPGTDQLLKYAASGIEYTEQAEFAEVNRKFFLLFKTAQDFTLPIKRTLYRGLREHVENGLEPHSMFLQVLSSHTRVAPTLENLNSLGALPILFPEFDTLVGGLYGPHHRTGDKSKDARALERIANLDALNNAIVDESHLPKAYFHEIYRDVSSEVLLAVRLALLLEEVPQSLADAKVGASPNRAYVDRIAGVYSLEDETKQLFHFILEYKRHVLTVIDVSPTGQRCDEWIRLIEQFPCPDVQNVIRGLCLFVFAAFDFEKSSRLTTAHWSNLQSFCDSMLARQNGERALFFEKDLLEDVGQKIADALPDRLLVSALVRDAKSSGYDLYSSTDNRRAHGVIDKLRQVCVHNDTRIEVKQKGHSYQIVVYTFDQPGVLWKIVGALTKADMELEFTELYPLKPMYLDGEAGRGSPTHLIVDALTFSLGSQTPENWRSELTDEIRQRLDPAAVVEDENNVAALLNRHRSELAAKLTELTDSGFKFSFHSPERAALVYAASRLLSEQLNANIFSVSIDGTRDWRVPRMNIYFQCDLEPNDMCDRLGPFFGNIQIAYN